MEVTYMHDNLDSLIISLSLRVSCPSMRSRCGEGSIHIRQVYLSLVWLRGMGLKWLLFLNWTHIFG
jgi:hypothetical protein